MAQGYRPGKRLYVTKDRSKVVPEDSPEAAILLVSATGEIPLEEARRLGLLDKPATKQPAESVAEAEPEGEEVEAKAIMAPPEHKAVESPAAMKEDEPSVRTPRPRGGP